MRNTLFKQPHLSPYREQRLDDPGRRACRLSRGVTHFYPPRAQKRCPVLLRIQDGQAHLQVSTIQELQPDVIFTQSTCQACLWTKKLKNQLVGMAEPVRDTFAGSSQVGRVFGAALQIADALGWPEQGKAYVEALRRPGGSNFCMSSENAVFKVPVGFLEWLDLFFTRVIGFQIRFAWQGCGPLAKPGQKKTNPYHGGPSWLQTRGAFALSLWM